MGKLTIQEIATVLAKNGLKKREANSFVSNMFALIQERLETDQQVKVRGLGTFKIIDVDARESVSVHSGERFVISGHSKVSFTPDATMKELVNKPFSQFETVVLNDGVDFADISADAEDDNSEEVDETENVSIPEAESKPENVLEEEIEDVPQTETPEKPIMPLIEIAPEDEAEPENEKEPDSENEAEPEIVDGVESEKTEETELDNIEETELEKVEEDEPENVVVSETIEKPQQPEEPGLVSESEQIAEAEKAMEQVTSDESEGESQSDIEEEPSNIVGESKKNNSIFLWILGFLGVVGITILSVWAGYNYGLRKQVVIVPDTILVRDTVVVAPLDTAKHAELVVDAKPDSTISPAVEAPKAEPVKEVTTPKPVAKEAKQEIVDKYAQKDARVRLGAYRIIGLEREVKVQAGQTFYSICKGNLGPDMECYVEVYNDLPRNPQIKIGQVIKIPKLQLKKRRK